MKIVSTQEILEELTLVSPTGEGNWKVEFNERWIKVDDEYKELLEIFEACNDSRVYEIQVLLSNHLKKLYIDGKIKEMNKND